MIRLKDFMKILGQEQRRLSIRGERDQLKRVLVENISKISVAPETDIAIPLPEASFSFFLWLTVLLSQSSVFQLFFAITASIAPTVLVDCSVTVLISNWQLSFVFLKFRFTRARTSLAQHITTHPLINPISCGHGGVRSGDLKIF